MGEKAINVKENIMKVLTTKGKKSMTADELLFKCGLRKGQIRILQESLTELLDEGLIIERRGDKFAASEVLNFFPATITKVNGNYGFAKQENAESEIFIPGRALLGAMPGDFVLLKSLPSRGQLPEGEVIKIVKEGRSNFSGVFIKEKNTCYVYPDKLLKFPVFISKGNTKGARSGDKVMVSLIKRGKSHYDHVGKVVEVYGPSQSAAACALAILDQNDIQIDFSPFAQEEAKTLSILGIKEEEKQNRLDLRGEKIFTIDSADTKDIDDAVSIEKTEKGYKLGVHIADVSHYVKPGSALDSEAFSRGTSVYFANSVVPMLPKELSNGICSLNPNEDRLAFSCFINLSNTGRMESYSFHKSIIRSNIKGVYSEINTILDDTATDEIKEKYHDLIDIIFTMKELADILTKRRYQRGGLNLESTESKIIIDYRGIAVDVVPRERGESEKIIEEFMLTANEAAATFALDVQIPFVYRIHEEPSADKIAALHQTLSLLGCDTKRINIDLKPYDLAAILNKSKGTPIEKIINTHILRSMAKAKYSPENKGHFGLVLNNYCHFTSPIRRYPDLAIHRILTDLVNGVPVNKITSRYTEYAVEASLKSSEREIKAMTVERDCEDCYKAEYISNHIGEDFKGVISSVAPHGIYVELENTVEGLVKVENMPEGEYEYDNRMTYTELRSNKKYTIGDMVMITVLGCDISAGQIDFAIIEPTEEDSMQTEQTNNN